MTATLGMMYGDLAAGAVLVVSAVGSERRDWAIHLVEQGAEMGRIEAVQRDNDERAVTNDRKE